MKISQIKKLILIQHIFCISDKISEADSDIRSAFQIASLVGKVQLERGLSARFLSSNRSDMAIMQHLLEARQQTLMVRYFFSNYYYKEIIIFYKEGGPSSCDGPSPIFSGPPL